MRVLVTGAQGFIGRYTVARWLAADPQVEIVGVGRSPRLDGFTHFVHRGSTRVRAPLPHALRAPLADARHRYERVDMLDRPALMDLLRSVRPDVVVHLATSLRDEPPAALMRNNVEAVVSLLEAIAGAGVAPPRVVLGSTGAVYGRPTALPLDEAMAGAPADLYAVSKRAAEDAAAVLAARDGLPIVVARIFNPVGPGQDERHLAGHLARQAAEIADGLTPPRVEVGPLDTTRDFVDVRDVADALRTLAIAGEPGRAYNVGSGVETSGEALLQTLFGDVEIHRLPGRAGDIPRHFAAIERLRALGWAPRHALADALADLVAWYRDEVAAAAAHDGEDEEPLGVEVRATWSYPIEVEPGLLSRLPERLRGRFPGVSMTVLTDDVVHCLYGRALHDAMRDAGIDTSVVVLAAGERSKAMDPYQEVIERMHAAGFGRRSVLVCLGGGLITDVGGFVAATYMRSVPYVNVPTTLLAQHDSGIGGKVAVNAPWAKKFVGAFHHPRAVYCDPGVLATLDRRNLAAGVAEAIKVALTGDATLFGLLEAHAEDVLAGQDAALLATIVRRAARRKIALLDPDPYEVDLRRALNLGHTLAHPLETEMEYAGLLHGEAVGFGIAVATEVARARGVCPPSVASRIRRLLDAYGLPPEIPRARRLASLARLREIRLVRGGHLHFVMPAAIDRVRIVPEVGIDELARAMDAVARGAVAAEARFA